ncbi:hypothetical protein A6395_01840 [Exiguobacterium sp. SH31]|uniref:hypothetical protein n=1 Tax=unclassified Exiguobacterium TaxID=2644629 RepID=UPI0008BECF87|nr:MULTISPECIES: hypothetical protein [unclassified Exiguobacterium]OGX80344.1 hypothetical protein A6395_01840 [Exiguobacterium sp. SH31]TCI72992.1 hypothetical protein EVJ22_00905 [Exiguobacterium sp. SH0S7]
MNFDNINVQQLHAKTFQTINLFQLKTIWSGCLPHASYRVTDFSELNLHVTKPQLIQLRWIDLTLPFGIYSNEKLVFLYDPYARELHTEEGGILEQNHPNVSIVDFLIAHGQTFHDPDSYSLKMEDAYGLSPDSHWGQFGLPKVKAPAAFIANLLTTFGVISFQVVLYKNKLLSDIESWAKRTGSNYTVESSGKWVWPKTYKVSCDVSQQSEQAIHQLVSILDHYEEWEGNRFLIPTETETVSLFIGGNLTQGYGYGVFQYEHPGEVVSNEI